MLLDHLTDAASFPTMSSFNPASTVVLPPTPDQYFISSHYIEQNAAGPAVNSSSSNGNVDMSQSQSTPFNTSGTTPGSLAGRKRSRGDIFSDDEEGERFEDGSISNPSISEAKMPRGKPVYGSGMTVLYPEDPSYAMSPESQSGTWVEEHAERKPLELTHTKRPSVTSRKSQRMDSRASEPDDLAQLVLPPQMRDVTREPLIDEATRALGISWARMDSTEALLINQAAYGKWIQNHYPGLKEVSIWFENSALPGYLVVANNVYNGQHEYYIFSHDLTEARLVTTEPSQLLPRLKMLPALHLAAPGGHIRAEADPIIAAHKGLNKVQGEALSDTGSDSQPSGACAAHAMELD